MLCFFFSFIFPSLSSFKGKRVAVSGEFKNFTRDAMKAALESLGATFVNPSKSTDFVVVGTNPGQTKMKKVQDYKLAVLSEEDVLKQLEILKGEV